MSKTKTFEEKMQRLEEIVSLMGDSKVTLSESVKLYKEGTNLVESLEKELEKIEDTVSILIKKTEGHVLEDYDE